jgi:hypothetical protein
MTANETDTPKDEKHTDGGAVVGHTDTLADTPTAESQNTKSAEGPVDYDPAHVMANLRTEHLHDTDTDADVSVVLDGDDVELRVSATLENVEQLAGRDLLWVTLGAKNIPAEDHD